MSQVTDLLRQAAKAIAVPPASFVPGQTYVPVSGKVVGEREVLYALLAVADQHFTEGAWTDRLEEALERAYGLRHALFVNSGSSANLLAVAALCDRTGLAKGDWRAPLERGDRVVTAAVGFPTTVNPLLQHGLEVVLVDVEPTTYVPTHEAIMEAVAEFGAKAVIMAHTLGNPWPVDLISEYRAHVLIVEDNCDAFGSRLSGRLTGTTGDLATQSFYPAHHVTTGEGGAVLTDSGRLARVVESLRDWGRSCWCPPGKENTCGKRFEWDFSPLPLGTDHKYVYERIGYNLKATDMQAAIGVAQMKRVNEFIQQRKDNWIRLKVALYGYQDIYLLPEPSPRADPSWFGFAISLRPDQSFSREDLCRWLEEERRIASRPLFAGYIPDQPAYREAGLLKAGPLETSQAVGRDGFWVGVWPGLGETEIDWIAESLAEAAESARAGRVLS